jgi:hypothetical protein
MSPPGLGAALPNQLAEIEPSEGLTKVPQSASVTPADGHRNATERCKLPFESISRDMASLFRDMLDQLFNSAAKEGTEFVHCVRVDVRPMVVGKLGKRHSVQARGLSDLLDRHAPALPELEIGDSFFEFKS